MVENVKIENIEEFSKITRVPKDSIDKQIIENIKELNEENQLEPFLKEILYHPDETPHGPTEISDILTLDVHVKNEKQVTAFVIKGKSSRKVKSKNIAHQFTRLERVPEIDMMVLVAVGNIQDDAKTDFMQSASNAGCNYLIINAYKLARLLIAYQKICPEDGTPYDETGKCQKGHSLDEGTKIKMPVDEEPKYSSLVLEDVSHGGAKRYSGKILIDKHYSRDDLREVIVNTTEDLKSREYYRNSRVKQRWAGHKAHVVWLFVGHDQTDILQSHWKCRSCWIDPNLDESMKPIGIDGDETVNGIDIKWSKNYTERKEFYEKHSGKKEDVLKETREILKEMKKLANRAAKLFNQYKRGVIKKEKFLNYIDQHAQRVSELYMQAGDIPFAPPECDDFDLACQDLFATVDNMFLYHSEKGRDNWPKENRDWLMKKEIEKFKQKLEEVEYEKNKLS